MINKSKRFDQINVIPFIDIMLVLLVIVLTTATFLNSSIKVDLPSASSGKSQSIKDAITITITNKNLVYIGTKAVNFNQLNKIIEENNKEQPYIIKGDKESKLEHFISVIDIFKKQGIKNVSILTKQ